ncbi:GNAT family N-acetyltransferase [Ideonella sp.]|uniref:GNAT family N-acetyltransferase n=1 Tax=Ideonella sp. TaxID=1929293 RepID=UPI0035ADBA3D
MKELPIPTMPLFTLFGAGARASTELATERAGRMAVPARTGAPTSMPEMRPAAPTRAEDAFEVVWARHQEEVRAAQRLRHVVFAGEMGARLSAPPHAPAGHDVDLFDDFCEHLLVRTMPTDDQPAEVIGTYRVLTPEAARRAGGFYSETEFDLTRLRPLRPRLAELGRSCVHPDHRSGGVILSLWAALAGFMTRNGLDNVVGCASVGMRDGGHSAASLWARLRDSHLASVEYQVRPRLPLPVDDLDQTLDVEPPALIKGYLRCGARVLGAPAWDPDFQTADLPMLLRLADLPARYRRHFLGA